MYITKDTRKKLRVYIPAEIICNNDIKQLLPVYVTLFMFADQTAELETARTFTLRQFCQYTGTFNVAKIRHGQYFSLRLAFEWLSDAGYVTFYDLDFKNTKQPFKYKMADNIYELTRSRDGAKSYVYAPIDEIRVVHKMLLQQDRYDSFTIKAMRVYYAMRTWTFYWQKNFKTKLPAWCSHFSSIYKFAGVTERTFNRVLKMLIDADLITVLHVDPAQRRTMYIPSVIVVFNYYCNEDAVSMIRKVEERFDSIYGTNIHNTTPIIGTKTDEMNNSKEVYKYKSEQIGYYEDDSRDDGENGEYQTAKFLTHSNSDADGIADSGAGFEIDDFGIDNMNNTRDDDNLVNEIKNGVILNDDGTELEIW